jgi:hypothetical protein
MKEQINKFMDLARCFDILAEGIKGSYMGGQVEVWYSSCDELNVTFFRTIDVWFYTKWTKTTEVNLIDVDNLDNLPQLILECETYLRNYEN